MRCSVLSFSCLLSRRFLDGTHDAERRQMKSHVCRIVKFVTSRLPLLLSKLFPWLLLFALPRFARRRRNFSSGMRYVRLSGAHGIRAIESDVVRRTSNLLHLVFKYLVSDCFVHCIVRVMWLSCRLSKFVSGFSPPTFGSTHCVAPVS